MMHIKKIRSVKPVHFSFPFLFICVCYVTLAVSCLTSPAIAHAQGDAVNRINNFANGNVGGSMISLTREVTAHAVDSSSLAQHAAAWRADKMGASSATIASHLEIRDNLKGASNTLGFGGKLIDHAGYASTAAGEMAEGSYSQGFITIADGVGKWAVSTVASAAGGVLGTSLGPAGTIAGGAAAGYLASEAWDATAAKVTSGLKDWLGEREAKQQFKEMSTPKMQGMTAEQIHEKWLKYKEQLAAGKNTAPTAKPQAAKTDTAKTNIVPAPTDTKKPKKDETTNTQTSGTADEGKKDALSGNAPTGSGSGQISGTFPNSPFNGLQITYSVSGATATASKDSDGFTNSRSISGRLGTGPLSVKWTVKATKPICNSQYGSFYSTLKVTVWVGDVRKEFSSPTNDDCGKAAESYSGELSVPFAAGAKSGGFSIEETYLNPRFGSRGLVVSGQLENK
ncbi:MAG: hypothetical protein HQK88_13310 [Nitrospirae bacterium]|nr:hypothetical protein [Nitrospirota bacterium]MBF0535887.1 hypothetical protein [Nitrospirota bacterium]MBF0617780.1 hypothetical protein [Nitrospirota bacterium]